MKLTNEKNSSDNIHKVKFDAIEPVNLENKVEILATDSEKLNIIGNLFSTESTRTIFTLLLESSLTIQQISEKTNISIPLVARHLKNMQEAGIVKIDKIGKNTKNRDMKYYTSSKFVIVILPPKTIEKVKKSKSIKNAFTRMYRFAVIGGATLASWFLLQYEPATNISLDRTPYLNTGVTDETFFPALVSLVVLVIGLITERIIHETKNKN